MGIYYSGVIVVGLPFEEVCESADEFYEKYEGELDKISPYYDAVPHACLVGLVWQVSGDYRFKELTVSDGDGILLQSFKERFKKVTGKDAKVYLSPWGT